MEYVDDHFGTVTETATRRVKQVEKGYTYFHNWDVLFAKITPCMENGKCAIARNLVNGIGFGSTEFHVVRPKHDVMPEWIFYFLRQHSTRQEAARHMTGTAGQQRVPTRFLQEIMIPLPPLPEQKRIAAILAKADRLRRLRRTARDLSDTYLQSVFLEMFGDPVSNPMGWKISEMGTQIKSIRYGTGSPPEYQKDGIPFIRATNIKKGTVQQNDLVYISEADARSIAKCKVNAGDLILVRSGINTGDCALIPREFDGGYAAYDLIIQVPYPQNYYYNVIINSDYGKSIIRPLSRRAGQPHINADQVKSLRFPVPPMPLQEEFAHIVHKLGRLHAQQREAERQAEHLFQTLLHRAFRGEL
jgi:type I restriction enzyme S subunit